jgi:dTDP-4-amino-4,6-dideoxygalactose transaminase
VIRLTIPSIEEEELAAAREVLATGFLVQGKNVAALEELIAAKTGARHAVVVSSCTAALHLSLLALDVGPGDLVATSAFSWPAAANAAEVCGAKTVFVDVFPDTMNLDPARLEQALADHARRVKAVVPVHAFGQMADMGAVKEICARRSIPVIEDAACALGASFDGKPAGCFGIMGCFSFHPRKAITTGEGGAVVTDDGSLARRLRALRNHGLDPEAPTPDFLMPGLNYRMTEFQAAVGRVQMGKLDRVIEARRRLAKRYDGMLAGTEVLPPACAPGASPVHQSYVVRLPAEAVSRRAEIIAGLREDGIETTIGTWHVPMTRCYRDRYGYREGDFPGTDEAFSLALTLPLYEGLSESDQDLVVSRLLARVRSGGR